MGSVSHCFHWIKTLDLRIAFLWVGPSEKQLGAVWRLKRAVWRQVLFYVYFSLKQIVIVLLYTIVYYWTPLYSKQRL